MKKYVTILFILLVVQTGQAQRIEQLFSKYKTAASVEEVKIGPVLLALSSLFTETMGVNQIEVLDFGACNNALKNSFNQDVRKLKDPTFETLVTSNENNERVKVLVRTEQQMIREVVICVTGKDHSLIRIKGKIKPKDLERVMQSHS